MVRVTKKKGESTKRLISRFRDKVVEENIIDTVRGAAFHESAAERRKRKKYRLERIFERQRSSEN